MNAFRCFRCSQINISVEGLRCSRCDNDESRRTEVTENFQPPLPEPGNVSPGYYVPTADASPQTVEDFMLLESTRQASTKTTDNDFNFLAQIVGCHGHDNCTKNDCSSQVKTSQEFNKDSNANQNLTANPNTNEDKFHNQSYDICSPATVGTLLESMDEPHVASQQRTYIYEQSSIDEYENKPDYVGLIKCQGTMEPTEYVYKVGKLDFTGSNSFQLQFPTMNYSPEKVQENVNIPSVFSSVCRRKPSINKCFQENLVTAKALTEKAQTSFDMSKKCRKCGRRFKIESIFYAHTQNNCDPNPFKCDKCDEKFPSERKLMQHQRVYTGEKPFKCSQCDYASYWSCDVNTHLKTHTRK